ncbi:MAG: hypothetical protein ABWY52_08495 [Candidatus Limnocylindrales bacterium]
MARFALIPGQRTRALTALLSCALLLSLFFAMPASAAGPLKLTAGSADPGSGTAGDTFTFAATYVSKDDAPPAFVRVIVGGKVHDMKRQDSSDSDMRDGARYTVSIRIKTAGRFSYSFAAQDSKGRDTSLAGGTVRVAPKPKTSPKPAPKPTARPAPSDSGSNDAQQPTNDSTTDPTDAAGAGAGVFGLLRDYDGGPGSGGPGGVGPAALGPVDADGSGQPGSNVTSPSLGAEPAGVGSEQGEGTRRQPALTGIAALAVTLPGVGSDQWLALAARSAVIATGAAAVVAMALFTFKRRRREDEDEDPFDVPTRGKAPDEASASGATPKPTEPGLTGEAAMPRWRRPSLNEARKADPGTSLAAIEAERLTFARNAAAADPANERRRIRYRMVRLADSPDEILGQEIGRLDEGDEVELLERSGLYWKVRTPPGQIGWVHKMTLGDAVPNTQPAASGDDETDGDVLAAFNEAQAMRGFQPLAEPVLGEGLAARFIRERGAS